MGKPEGILESSATAVGESRLIDLIVFDLDGTLIDSSRDLAISVNAARAHFDLAPLSQEIVNSYVGNGAAVLVRRAIGPDASEDRIAEALSFFLAYYREHSLEHTRLYPGVRECVDALHAQGYKLAVLTNKPEKISFDILKALGTEKIFLRIIGGNTLTEKKPNPIGLIALSEEANTSPERALMVGDSSVDIQTARNAGSRSCGVLWGFQPETLSAVPPDFTIAHPSELLAVMRSLVL